MRSVALLIGFQYMESGETPIPGIIIDLYLAYQFARAWASDVRVVTDIKADDLRGILHQAIVDGIVDVEIQSFLHLLEQRRELYPFTTMSGPRHLQATLEGLQEVDHFFVYYSGHGLRETLILPSRDRVHLSFLRSNITACLTPTADVFWVMDCCFPSSLELPYKLVGNVFRYQPQGYPERHRFICLIAAEDGAEESVATYQGSFLSRALFKLLGSGRHSLSYLQKELQLAVRRQREGFRQSVGRLPVQTINIYAAYPDERDLWPWLYAHRRDVVINWSTNTIQINC